VLEIVKTYPLENMIITYARQMNIAVKSTLKVQMPKFVSKNLSVIHGAISEIWTSLNISSALAWNQATHVLQTKEINLNQLDQIGWVCMMIIFPVIIVRENSENNNSCMKEAPQ
jgi:hypothetical protein